MLRNFLDGDTNTNNNNNLSLFRVFYILFYRIYTELSVYPESGNIYIYIYLYIYIYIYIYLESRVGVHI